MKRIAWALATGASLAALAIFAACSSNGATSGGTTPDGGGGEAGTPADQALGAPCDPSLVSPCLASTNPCASITCNATTQTCTESATGASGCDDGGADASDDASTVVAAPCTTLADCETGLVCGFLPLEGCSATGTCVPISAPELPDGAIPLACSCDGVDVGYVTSTLTSAPVASPTPCPDAGQGASDDAGLDGSTDAGDGGDASHGG